MASGQKRKSIDLLNPINPPTDVWTTIYNWVFTVGRYLLVGIEALLLVVFFSRFVMDEINSKLTDEINDKVAILSDSEFRSREALYTNIHSVLTDVKNISDKQEINSEVIAQITSAVPGSLSMDTFSYNKDRVSMNLKSTDLKSIKDYEFSLRQNTRFKDVIVTLRKSDANSSEIDVSISFSVLQEDKNGTGI